MDNISLGSSENKKRMEVAVEGYLNPNHNPKLYAEVVEGPLDDVKSVFIKLIDGAQIEKLKNVLKQYQKNGVNINTPVCKAKEGGLGLKLNTQKLSKYMGLFMLRTPRADWFNKAYKVRFTVHRYSYSHPEDPENKIQGISFLLKGLDLLI